MSQEKIKIPKKDGLEKARQRLKEICRKEPSSELVKIIEEVTNQTPQKPEVNRDDIAARPRQELDI